MAFGIKVERIGFTHFESEPVIPVERRHVCFIDTVLELVAALSLYTGKEEKFQRLFAPVRVTRTLDNSRALELGSANIKTKSSQMFLSRSWRLHVSLCLYFYQLSWRTGIAQDPQVNFTECIEDARFFLVQEEVIFEDAKVSCEERSGSLARISNAEEHTFIESFFNNIGLDEPELVWIGN